MLVLLVILAAEVTQLRSGRGGAASFDFLLKASSRVMR